MTEENEQRMERLFHDHYEQMYRFAFALLHDNEEARDVVSDVFSRLWDKQLVPDRAYLMRSVKNACINLIARKKRDERLKRLLPLSEEKLTEEEPSRLEERWQAAVDCIDHDLTDQTASVIRLCYREGMSHQRLGSEQAYRKRFANAQRKVERKIIRQSFRQDSLCRKKVLRQVFRRICNPSLKKGLTSLFCGFAIRLYNNPKMKKGKENET